MKKLIAISFHNLKNRVSSNKITYQKNQLEIHVLFQFSGLALSFK